MIVVITAEAENDLEDIFDHIAIDSPRLAREFVEQLRAKSQRIGDAPRAYPKRPQYGPGIRVSFLRSYLTLFRINADRVDVIHFVHGARDLKRLFDD